MSVIMDGNIETPKRLKDLARNQMILIDLQICEIEGWDKKEYISLLQDLLDGNGKK